NDEVTLAVLAGEESAAAMELSVEEKPLLAWLLDRFNWPGPTLLVGPRASELGHERFSRQIESDGSPIQSVLAALEHLQTPLLVVTPLNMPGITRMQIDWLLEMLRAREDVDILAPSRLSDGKVLVEPFPAAFRAGAKTA